MHVKKIFNRKNKTKIAALLAALIITVFLPANEAKALAGDVTNRVVNLGQPFKQEPFARNVWDMQVFDGKIYLGSGNYLNQGPSPNAGPVPVMYYDPQTKNFVNQYTVDEEQIDVYKIIEGKLTIPGTDARESWNYGNYYVLENGKWQKKRTIPKAVHVYDMAWYKGKLYAGIEHERIAFTASGDGGNTWTSQMPSSGLTFGNNGVQGRTLFEFKGILYGTGCLFPGISSTCSVLVTDGARRTVQNMPNLLPNAKRKFSGHRIMRPCTVNNNLVYLGVINDESQWFPDALYAASDIDKPRRVALPQVNAFPSDILIRGNKVYILAYWGSAEAGYTNIVYQSEDLSNWTELFQFKADTFARSFEELNGDFYLGLGCDAYPLSDSSGKIIEVPGYAYE